METTDMIDGIVGWLTVQGINIATGLVILLVGWWVARIITGAATRWMERSDRMDPIVESFLASLLYYGLIALIVIIALNVMGVQTTSLIAVLGAASLAVGLALQGSLTSLAAGVMIILMRPFRIGDYVEVAGHAGTVRAINLFLTELATFDNIQVLLPNSQVWGSAVTNYSVYATRMTDIEVGIDYEDDIDAGLKVLREVAEGQEKVLADPEPNVFVSGIGDSAVKLTLRAWVATDDYWPMRRELTKRAKEALERNGLTVPVPQRAITMRSAPERDAA
jgi:small conductance mechanosensitive channel